jgi:lysophospholipase L1-like esterase
MKHRQPAGKVSSNCVASLRITGFGACMISGYPHQSGGLFEVTCGLVEDILQGPVQSDIISLGGFSAPRAAKYLKRKVFSFSPDYIVIQFGATDAKCPIRSRNRPSGGSTKFEGARGNALDDNHPATALCFLRWEVASVLGFILQPQPVTALSRYIVAIEGMVDDCISAGITPIVLSPFVFGSRYATRNAALYADALRELLSRVDKALFVDCNRLLTKFPRLVVLLKDGFHLSVSAHELIGQAIGRAIVADLRAKRANFEEPKNTNADELLGRVTSLGLS